MNELDRQIHSLLKELNLQAIIDTYKDLSFQAAKNNLGYDEYLAIILEMELKRKRKNSVNAKIHKAKLPFFKTIEDFDFSFQPSLNEKELITLASLDFIDNKHNVIFLGPPGVGKTHLAVALAIKACNLRFRVLFTTAQALIEELLLSKRDGSLLDKLLIFSRLNLLIIDELGYMPISKEQANLLFQLVSMRYEKGSIVLTSNYNFDQWGEIFDDNVVASAIIDRLVHHASIFFINGSSFRLKGKFTNNA